MDWKFLPIQAPEYKESPLVAMAMKELSQRIGEQKQREWQQPNIDREHGFKRDALEYERLRNETFDPLKARSLEADTKVKMAELGLLPGKAAMTKAQLRLVEEQIKQAQTKDEVEQFIINRMRGGPQPAGPSGLPTSPVQPQSFGPTPERPAIMTPATMGGQPPAPTGDPMLIRTQGAPGQPQPQAQAPHDPIVETWMGPMRASEARRIGGLLAYKGKPEAGKMLADPADPTKLPKEALNEIGKDEVKLTESLGRMREISRQFRPEFLTFEEQAKQYGISWLDKFDATRSNLTPEQIQQHAQYTAFRRDTVDNLNRYIKEITGAAMGVEEAKRIISAQPNMDDGPTAFMAKIKATQRAAELAVARARILRRNGFNGQPWDGNPETAARAIPLEKMKSDILQDSRQTYQQIRQQFPQADDKQIQGAVRAHIRAKYGMDI